MNKLLCFLRSFLREVQEWASSLIITPHHMALFLSLWVPTSPPNKRPGDGISPRDVSNCLRDHHFVMRSSASPALDAGLQTQSLFGSPEPGPPDSPSTPAAVADWCKPEDAAVD